MTDSNLYLHIPVLKVLPASLQQGILTRVCLRPWVSLKAKVEDSVLGRVCGSGRSKVLREQTDWGARCLGLRNRSGRNASALMACPCSVCLCRCRAPYNNVVNVGLLVTSGSVGFTFLLLYI